MKTDGAVETAGKNDKYSEKFYTEEKGAFYLKGKIKGKYLITSSYNSQKEKQNEFFKYLNPDDYYPLYGDFSDISYDATDTRGNFYLLVEWDLSKIKWGNYQVNLRENSLISYFRTYYGGMAEVASVKATEYGDPLYKALIFGATPETSRSIDRIEAKLS